MVLRFYGKSINHFVSFRSAIYCDIYEMLVCMNVKRLQYVKILS